MLLIVGLGNPGKKFEKTRHNIGFRIVDELRGKNNFSDFKLAKKFNAEVSEGFLNEEVILAKPQTFMNDSGKSVKKIFLNLKSEILNLFIVHDDLDLPLGKIRISAGRGAAGHKGVESIIRELKTKDFVRFRVGIRPINDRLLVTNKGLKNSTFQTAVQNVEKFVLQKFNKEEEKILKEVIKKTIEAIEVAIEQRVEKAMSRYSQ